MSLDAMWKEVVVCHSVGYVRVRLIRDAVMTFENTVGENPFEDPCRGILCHAEIIDRGYDDLALRPVHPSCEAYKKYVGIHVVITIALDQGSVNPTLGVAMTSGLELYVSGDLEGVYDGKCDIASYYIIRAKTISSTWMICSTGRGQADDSG